MRIIITLVSATLVFFTFKKYDINVQDSIHVPNRTVYSDSTEIEKFLKHMAHRESNNTKYIINKFGMMGKYQFSPSTIRILGFKFTKQQFLSDDKVQDSVMVAYMRANNRELRSIIEKYDGKTVKGVKITRAGILAAAHLGGSGSVINYFRTSDLYGTTDANGTSVREYMQTFSKYNLPSDI
jgi:hypothetical protein